jgi:hypothetical protein
MKSRNPSARVALGAPIREATARPPNSTAVRDIDGPIHQRTQHLTNKESGKSSIPADKCALARMVPASPVVRTVGKPALLTLSREGEQAPFGHGKQIMNSRNGEQNQKRRSQLSITTAVFSASLPPMRPSWRAQQQSLPQRSSSTAATAAANLPWKSDALFFRESRFSNITSGDVRRIR